MPERAVARLVLVSALALAPGGAALAQQFWDDPPPPPAEAPGLRGWQLTFRGGRYDPTGPSLEGFPSGVGFGARLGRRFSQKVSLELEIRRTATTLEDEYGFEIDVHQLDLIPALRVHGSIGPLATEGAAGLGWYRTRTEIRPPWGEGSPVESGQSRLGVHLSFDVVIPVVPEVDVLVGATYGGAYATVFDYNPVWVGGYTLELGLQLNLLERPAPAPSRLP